MNRRRLCQVCLVFVTGRGGAGIHPRGPAVTRAGEGFLGAIPAPSPVRGESPLIPWTGPRFLPPNLTGACPGNGRGPGRGLGIPKKHAPPQAVQRGGAGNRAGGPLFLGPRRPRNER